MSDDVVIVSATRTAIGKFQGAYQNVPATELGAAAIKNAIAHVHMDGTHIDECIMGNVIGAGLGQAPARQAALHGGLPNSVSALTINKVCGSGLKAVMLAHALIRNGDAKAIVAGGMENMSRGPHLLPQARSGYRLGNGELLDATVHDGLWCAFENHHMGNSAEWIARTFDVTREVQDQFALRSHQRAIAAQEAGRFDNEIVPLEVSIGRGKTAIISTDEPPRRDTNAATLGRLSPAFVADGTVTAGNAPGITDGAAALVVMSAAKAKELGLQPLARIIGVAQAAVKPLEIFTAPVFAVQRLMDKTKTQIDDYDLFEINEAFASQVIANARELGIDEERLNINGGAIALGHPIGASGARVLVTLIHALRQQDKQRGIAALCLGGGEAVALAVERVS
ncbi:MAG: acetyl-CoA C-acetyltransferase [Chloroflexi bacterium AL-W]|nr:acetyl-CoA C-acetyltransferase [Chloroflexi bacterium AL-N1]NOK70903.1 acetyl-CoA C-acetyltransferase [Chloroflexi bacterium AL-N10]NOK78572.1 acetyl-CoA C-acetyltransferase [Chloroflexi bacterium AL-N5]NOK85804.1 acetyl-CoA C-acetyltransferase [Chloroflexi bacterium AL-W]NOK92720.1 acetyl-CoA C-acetyltransferase [Chloroflexi bacterium AL-N15]